MTPREAALEDLLTDCRGLKGKDSWSDAHLRVVNRVSEIDRLGPNPAPTTKNQKVVVKYKDRDLAWYGMLITYVLSMIAPIVLILLMFFL